MSAQLMPGDQIQFLHNGRKLRGVVADTLNLKTRGEELLVPVIRPFNRKIKSCHADSGGKPRQVKTRWLERSAVRKLPKK